MLSVRERGETAATLRWIHVRLMETIASWVPTTPEMEVKLLFGAHIWDLAQHADALGKRTHELRMPLQHSIPPADGYRELLADFSAVKDTRERVACFYDGVLASLADRYRTYLQRTDALMDAPSVRILEHIAAEQARMIRESRELREQLPALALGEREPVERLRTREGAMETFIQAQPQPAAAGASAT
jgi:hypothetical protein